MLEKATLEKAMSVKTTPKQAMFEKAMLKMA